MHIVQICDAQFPIKKYAGTERVVYWLSDALQQLGHQVTLIARPGSTHKNPAICIIPCEDFNHHLRAQIPRDVDIIHFHDDRLQPQLIGLPTLLTLHGNKKSLHPLYSCQNVVGVSHAHALSNQLTRYVYNGIDPDEFIFSETPRDGFLFLGKVSFRGKGAHNAVFAAFHKKALLTIAGGGSL